MIDIYFPKGIIRIISENKDKREFHKYFLAAIPAQIG
jgi:hypothetical protein